MSTDKPKRLGIDPFAKPSGLDLLIGAQPEQIEDKPKRGRPREIKRTITKSSQNGLHEGWTRATFIIKEDTLEKLKKRAYVDRLKLKDVISDALEHYLNNKDTEGK